MQEVTPLQNSNIQILVVEDNLVNQQILCLNLENLGYLSVVAENGVEALEILKTKKVDLIIMDCNMPKMDGYQATREIRKLKDTKISQIPIVALTANAMKGDREKCLAAGMDDYMTKPLKTEILKDMLEKWLSIRKNFDLEKKKEAGEGSQTVDLNTLRGLKDLQQAGKPDIIQKLITLFIESAESILSSIGQAAKNKDFKALAEGAHNLKSASANLGAFNLASLCSQLEELGDGNSPNTDPIKVQIQLESEFKKVKEVLLRIKENF